MSQKIKSKWATAIKAEPPLPIEGYIELKMPVEKLWQYFTEVKNWPKWNSCFFWSRITGGQLKTGETLYWFFNPIKPWYLYKMPALAKIVEAEPNRKVTWEVTAPLGFHARHSYLFESLGPENCRFGSWEVAEGPVYRLLRSFWLAHFRYVCQASLEGAQKLEREESRRQAGD